MQSGVYGRCATGVSHQGMQNHVSILTIVPSRGGIMTECKLAGVWHLARCRETTKKQNRLRLIVWGCGLSSLHPTNEHMIIN